ncbi:MAG TPA: hypothetical protein PK413_06065 [Thermoanaerobaculia bacterium]|nr:hypothetical protein [Thermoanaerobaculia bacterium]
MRSRLTLLVLALSLCALPLLAADNVIRHGTDAFTTTADGTTFVSFAKNPLPAGFFCEGSAPFAGSIGLKGRPMATNSPKLKSIDTVVERLDDATFDARGTALTRVRVQALSLVGTAPVRTSCGNFRVVVGLDGAQRETIMRITRQNELGGTFVAPLAVNTRITFVPVAGNSAPRRTVTLAIDFPGNGNQSWSYPAAGLRVQTPFLIDANHDGKPETRVAGAANFLAGSRSQGGLETWLQTICHEYDAQESHCYTLCDGCDIP